MVGMLHEQGFRLESKVRSLPDLSQMFAVTERRLPDTSKKYPVHEPREFAAKSLIDRTEVWAKYAEQAIFGENSL
jgi:hypothetical protein